MSDDLFGASDSAAPSRKPSHRGASAGPVAVPLAERLRPATLDEVAGQTHLLGSGKPLRLAFESGKPH